MGARRERRRAPILRDSDRSARLARRRVRQPREEHGVSLRTIRFLVRATRPSFVVGQVASHDLRHPPRKERLIPGWHPWGRGA